MEEFEAKTLKAMKEELSKLGLSTDGKRNELIQRYKRATTLIQDSFTKNVCGSECESRRNADMYAEKTNFAFKDVEDSVSKFSGDDNYPIKKWLIEFCETSELLGWSNLQRFVYAKRLLTGTAKMLLRSTSAKDWESLQQVLLDEFHVNVSSAAVHQMLIKAKKKKDETIHQYILRMREIGALADIENEVILEYIIDGVCIEDSNKIWLFDAKDFKDLRLKYEAFEKLKIKSMNKATSNNVKSNQQLEQPVPSGNKSINPRRNRIKCYNCNEYGHLSMDCQRKSDGVRCFKCNTFGHKSFECPTSSKTNVSLCTTKEHQMKIDVLIDDMKVCALIDTGSSVNLIRSDVYLNLNTMKPLKSRSTLTGLAGKKIETFGKFEANIVINGNNFHVPVHVVPNDVIPVNLLIGCDLLCEAKVIIDKNGVDIRKNDEFCAILSEVKDEIIDVTHIIDRSDAQVVKQLCQQYSPTPTKTSDVNCKIILKDETPISQNPRRLSIYEMELVDKIVEDWLKSGIIEPSSSEFSSPIVLVSKKDGSKRLCVDYRKINRQIVKDRFPLPLIEDQLNRLQDARVFSLLDLRNGFFHVAVEERSRKYTSFVTPTGQYQFRKVPFGLCNSPGVFMRFVNSIFRDLIRKGIMSLYLDDIIILAKDNESAIENLKIVLKLASEYGLDINWKKCRFLVRRVEYLGHVIHDGKISPSESKTRAVRNFPQPKTKKQIQQFLGLTGYFRKFVYNYSVIARPLSDLLREGVDFVFGEEEIMAFNSLKRHLTSNPVLQLFRHGLPTELHTDASMHGYGSILMQQHDDGKLHPIYYASRKTTDAEKKYSSYELEVLSIIYALKKFRGYLIGTHFKIITDCAAFEMTMKKTSLTTRVARWALSLEEFDYQINHRPGTRMKHVDALSRNPVLIVDDDIVSRLKCAQESDEFIAAVIKLLENGPYKDFMVESDLLYKIKDGNQLLVVPRKMQAEVIKRNHEIGHYGVRKVQELIERDFWFEKMFDKITTSVKNCVQCILCNRKAGKQEGYLHPIEKGNLPLHTIHLDHLGPMATTKKQYNHVLVMIDGFTKFVWIYATKSTTSKEVLEKLQKHREVFGNPLRIVTDKGTAFTSNEFKEYCEVEGIEHVAITTGLPRGNGQVERIHQSIISVLSKLSIDAPDRWFRFVGSVQQSLNNTLNRSISATPFELLVGTKMHQKTDTRIQEIINEEIIKNFRNSRDSLRETAKKQIEKIQIENRRSFRKNRKAPTTYKVGDLIAIKRTQFGPGLKLKPKFFGPYKVCKAKENERYDVERVGEHEGPKRTSTAAEFIKPWLDSSFESSGSDEE